VAALASGGDSKATGFIPIVIASSGRMDKHGFQASTTTA
jgi:hypothetical protein